MWRNKRIGIALLCLIGIANIIVPSPSLLSITIQVVPLSISGIYYHYFRKYLETVPYGSTTVNHYIFTSLTWNAQLVIGYIFLLNLTSYMFNSSLQSLAESHPWTLCLVLSPAYITIPLGVHFVSLAAIKLYISILPYRFVGLNHENLWRNIKGELLLISARDQN